MSELAAEVENAFLALEVHGVSRHRARTLARGINILARSQRQRLRDLTEERDHARALFETMSVVYAAQLGVSAEELRAMCAPQHPEEPPA